MLLTPGPDLRYLTGYRAVPLERLTCLVLLPNGQAHLILPSLEEPAALASPVGSLPIELHPWAEIDDPFARLESLLPGARSAGDGTQGDLSGGQLLLDDHMWASRVLEFQRRRPQASWRAAGGVMGDLRIRKTNYETEQLRLAGARIDAVHAQVAGWLWPGRTEREVAADIYQAILESGHEQVDFVIVASGSNAASPHHEPSSRELAEGDPVIVDIGGMIESGYRSDSTRTYCLGQPDSKFATAYEALQAAQAAGLAACTSANTCAEVDAACRDVLRGADLDHYFIHRTGHGIGLETHEPPYLVAGNDQRLEPGFAFSVEPGFYLSGQFGARIEDIVICAGAAPIVCNSRPRELVLVG